MFRKNKKLAEWQDKLQKAKAAYADELKNMDIRTSYYDGTADIRKKNGAIANRKASNVRNIVYELLESEVDSTIPMPRVEAIHEEDKELARGIEAMLRSEVQMLRLVEMNDIQERTTTIQGGALWQVDWDEERGFHCTMGDVAVTDRHPRQVIPQPGIYEIEQMDYIFVQVTQTKQAVKRKYGVDVAQDGEEAPKVRGEDAVPWDELVTQNIAYYRNKDGGIGRFSWVEDTVLEDMEDYQALHVKVCAVCGATKVQNDDTCPVCGAKKWKDEVQGEEKLFKDITLFNGTTIPWRADEEEREIMGPDGMPMLDEATGAPLMQTVTIATKIPRYQQACFFYGRQRCGCDTRPAGGH